MKLEAAIDKVLPLLLGKDSPSAFLTTRDTKLAKELDTAIDCLLFRRSFEAQCWLDRAKVQLERCNVQADAKTLLLSIKRVRDEKRTLLGVLVARRKSAQRKNKNV
jgi:hypothetical protein